MFILEVTGIVTILLTAVLLTESRSPSGNDA